MNKPTFLTDEGLKKLEDELDELKSVKRKEMAEKIKVALSFGDLSENAEYDEAKNEQAKLEARIAEIETMLKYVEIIDEDNNNTDNIHLGSLVKIYDEEFEEEIEYRIVGSSEADPLEGKISDESPVGAALIGHKVEDVIEIETPGGTIKFRVVEISK